MPAADDSAPGDHGGRVPSEYRISGGSATLSLRDLVVEEIRASGPMRLPRYLELALYHPEWGYYARGQDRVGKAGDFFTSVSVGPLFGGLLARWMIRKYASLGCPEAWRVVEFGANDGMLARDVMEAMRRLDERAWEALEYVICEPLPTMRPVQQARLEGFPVRVIGSPEELVGLRLPGVVYGNEVLDALPFHWVEWREGQWRERVIRLGGDGRLVAVTGGEPELEVSGILESYGLPKSLPDGWQCEVRTCVHGFLEQALRCVSNPSILWIDYGMEREQLLHAARTEGTWRAFRSHQVEPEPWDFPGECDVTAHVDFSAVREAVVGLGGRVTIFQSQGQWLTQVAAEELAGREGVVDPGWVRQFQTLTHPAQMGAQFQVMECEWRK